MGSFIEKESYEPSLPCKKLPVEPIEPFASHAVKLAVNYSLEGTESDGHWYGELKYAPPLDAILEITKMMMSKHKG